MKKTFTLLAALAFFSASQAQDFLRPDGAYASSKYIGTDGLSSLDATFLISPANQGNIIHPYFPDDVVGKLSEESATATHPTSISGATSFGAWHSAPNTKEHPVTDVPFDTPIEEQWVVLSFEDAVDLETIILWNIHQVTAAATPVQSDNEVKTFTVEVTDNKDTGTWKEVLGTSTLLDITDPTVLATGQSFTLTDANAVKYIRINVDSNYGHPKNVGLAEVRFTGTRLTAAPAISGLTMNKTAVSLDVAATVNLGVTIAPVNVANTAVTWTSSDDAVATVVNGTVTAVANGTATITATATDGGLTATSTITIGTAVVAADGVTVDQSTATLEIAGTVTLAATVTPAEATDKTVAWTSSDDAIATVADGVVTAVAAGTATITATSTDGSFAAISTITVNPAAAVAVTGVTVDQATASVETSKTVTLAATIAPTNATNTEVTWTSSVPAVATVTDGVVTGLTVGETVITATSTDGDFTATTTVTVTEAVALSLNPNTKQVIDVKVINNSVQIFNAVQGSSYSVYTLSGAIIQSGVVNSSIQTLPITEKGIFIISIGSQQNRLVKRVSLQ